jgi:hypothetical protein
MEAGKVDLDSEVGDYRMGRGEESMREWPGVMWGPRDLQ